MLRGRIGREESGGRRWQEEGVRRKEEGQARAGAGDGAGVRGRPG